MHRFYFSCLLVLLVSSGHSQELFDRHYYNLRGTGEVMAANRPLLQFQVRFSGVALMNNRSPVYYRLWLFIPLRKNNRHSHIQIKGDSLYKQPLTENVKRTERRKGIYKFWMYKSTYYLSQHGLSIFYSQSIVRGKFEVRQFQ